MKALTGTLKALAIMTLGGFGTGIFRAGMYASNDVDAAWCIGIGVFLLLGALFLYRVWFFHADR